MPTLLQLDKIQAQKTQDYSASELRDMLQKCLRDELNPTPPGVDVGIATPSIYPYVEEVYPSSNRFVYRVSGKTYMRSYSLGKDGKCKLSNDARPARQQWVQARADRSQEQSFERERVRTKK